LHIPLNWNALLIRDRDELPPVRGASGTKHQTIVSIAVLSFLLSATVHSAQLGQDGQGEEPGMSDQANFQLLIPNTMPKSVSYSQLAVVTGGTVVFIAGQVALDKSGNVVGNKDFKAQIQQVFENLKAAVEAAGGNCNHVVKLNSYFLDLSHLSDFREVRDKYINVKNPPASTAIQVSRLFRPEFLIEVEAVAIIPSN
jgi:enamine deaminase RidA (YjgF/YER057c/UK114 family)